MFLFVFTITPAIADKSEGVFQPLFYLIFGHRDRKNERGDNLEPNALIGIEFCEFRQKLKNYEFRRISSVWQSRSAASAVRPLQYCSPFAGPGGAREAIGKFNLYTKYIQSSEGLCLNTCRQIPLTN